MELASIRILADDLDATLAFYTALLGREPVRPHPLFAQYPGPVGLAIASSQTAAAYPEGVVVPGATGPVFVEFEVADPDALAAELAPLSAGVVMEPTDLPWGNRSAVLRDPAGTLVNLYRRLP